MINTNIILPVEAVKIIDTLNSFGFEAFAVGGCVRDLVLGRIPDDYDITTNALPEQIKTVFSLCKTIDTGIKHGTVTVIQNGFRTEVTTYRTDGAYTDNRHPDSVKFSNKIEDDLSRRDFTVNAMAYSPSSGLIDAFGGLNDLKSGVIRCVGDPKVRFKEDALRILRAVRFSSVLGFDIDRNTSAALHLCVNLLDNISAERIYSEIKKLLCGDSASMVLAKYRDIAERVFPEVSKLSGDEYEIAAQMVSNIKDDICLKIASFFYFSGAQSAHLMLKRLKCDNSTLKRVTCALSCDVFNEPSTEKEIKKKLFYSGETALKDALFLKIAYFKSIGDKDGVKRLLKLIELTQSIINSGDCFNVGSLALSGSDIAEKGLAEGREIGKMLNMLVPAVIDGLVKNERSQLLDYCAGLKIF